MNRRQIATFAALPIIGLLISTTASAAGSWDGAWGNGSPLISINGHTIAYSFKGHAYPVSEVKMSAKQLTFHAGQANVVMIATPDGKASFHFTLNGQTSNSVIWKQ